MKKKILNILLLLFFFTPANSEVKINPIYEGSIDSKIELIIYESLTCGHCASFHKNVLFVISYYFDAINWFRKSYKKI